MATPFENLLQTARQHRQTGNLSAALQTFEQAVRADPAHAEAHREFAETAEQAGHPGPALALYLVALAKNAQYRDLVPRIAGLLAAIHLRHWPPESAAALDICFREQSVEHQYFILPAMQVLLSSPAFAPVQQAAANAGWAAAADVFLKAGPGLLAHPLLQHILTKGVSMDIAFEQLMTAVRRKLLTLEEPPAHILTFTACLASQCLSNEFLYATNPEEDSALNALLDTHGTAAGNAQSDTEHLWFLLRYGLYRPLWSLPGIRERRLNSVPPIIAAYLQRAITERIREAEIRGTLPLLAPIEDAVSKRVQQQYEEHPFPCWQSLSPQPGTMRQLALEKMDPANAAACRGHGLKVLIAGCGTGKHALNGAIGYGDDADVTAIDLSRTSLAYAKRMAEQFDITNVHFMHGDLLSLSDTKETFDVIECVGTLNHINDPVQGWRALNTALVPGGVMKIGLYSHLARKPIHHARQRIHALGLMQGRNTDIQIYRQRLISGQEPEELHSLMRSKDFFALSSCRDMLFNVQEICFTLPEIKTSLAALGLKFSGFILPTTVEKAFNDTFGQNADLLNLDQWHQFETENTDCFINLYLFYCQKPKQS